MKKAQDLIIKTLICFEIHLKQINTKSKLTMIGMCCFDVEYPTFVHHLKS